MGRRLVVLWRRMASVRRKLLYGRSHAWLGAVRVRNVNQSEGREAALVVLLLCVRSEYFGAPGGPRRWACWLPAPETYLVEGVQQPQQLLGA